MLGYTNVTFTFLIVLIFLLAIPIMDTLFAIIRRLLKYESIAMTDKCHLHHQLLKLNFSIRKSILIIYLIDVLFVIASIIYVIVDSKHGIFIYILLFIVVIILIWKTDIISDKKIERKFLFFHK